MNLDHNPHDPLQPLDPGDALINDSALTIPELILLEQSDELHPALAAKLAAWREANREPAELLDKSIEALTRPLPDPGVPLHPLRRDHILKAGRTAHLERRRAESETAKQSTQKAGGKLISPVEPAWEADKDEGSSATSWIWAVAALAAVFLFGLYVANRPGPDGVPEIVDTPAPVVAPTVETVDQAPENIDNPLAHEVPAPMLVNADAIEAFLNEPYADFSSQLSELDDALFQSQVDLSDESGWLAQLD